MLESASWMQLREGESVKWEDNPCIWMTYQRLILSSLLFAFSIIMLLRIPTDFLSVWIFPGWMTAASVIAVALSIPVFYSIIVRKTTVYAVTNRGIHYKKGIYSRDADPIDFEDMADRNYSQSIFDRFVGKGDIEIMTKGTGNVEVVFEEVANPKEVMGYIDQARGVHQNQVRKQMAGETV